MEEILFVCLFVAIFIDYSTLINFKEWFTVTLVHHNFSSPMWLYRHRHLFLYYLIISMLSQFSSISNLRDTAVSLWYDCFSSRWSWVKGSPLCQVDMIEWSVFLSLFGSPLAFAEAVATLPGSTNKTSTKTLTDKESHNLLPSSHNSISEVGH